MTPSRSARWERLGAALATGLEALTEDQFLVIVRKDRPWFVQFMAQGAHGLRAELVSNALLEGDDRLPDAAFETARQLGWHDAPEAAEPAVEAIEPTARNFFHEWDQPVPFADVAALTLDTFTDVLATPNPDLLSYRAFTEDGDTILLPTLGLKPFAEPTSPTDGVADAATIRERMLVLLRLASGNNELEPDDEGDLPMRHGNVVAFLRVMEEPPIVRVFAPVLSETHGGSALLEALNELNERFPFTKWFIQDGTVIASIDISVHPLVEQHVLDACEIVGATADSVIADLQQRFGGRTFLGDYVRPHQSDESLGYL